MQLELVHEGDPVMLPDREGWWRWDSGYLHDGIREVEVYMVPYGGGHLCVWCEDIGAARYDQTVSDGDEMMGHIPVRAMEGEGVWTYLRPL